MDGVRFDTLVRGFGPGTTRRRALRLLGGGALAGILASALVPETANADAKKRCKRKKGIFLRKGQCKCAFTCEANVTRFPCQNNPVCICFEGVDGQGFCSNRDTTSFGCSTTADCPSGRTCVVLRRCASPVTSCTTQEECSSLPFTVCFKGKCELTECVLPCSV